MSLSDEDRVARSRLLMLTLIRLAGVALMALGLIISTGDLLRPGGWPLVGVPIALIGLVESLLLPKVFTAKWRTPKDL